MREQGEGRSGEGENGTYPFALSPLFPLVLSLLFVGCLPSSNQRKLDRALFPSDSLSRQIAEAAPVDTVQLVRRVEAPPEANMEYPTSLALTSGGIVVAETKRGALAYFDAEGGFERTQEGRLFSYPFVAGALGDTVAVLNRGTHRVDLVVGERSVRHIDVPEVPNGNALLTERGLFYKTAAEGEGATLYHFDLGGSELARYDLAGPYWRHFGFLRTWGDSLLSLSGYRPVVNVLPPNHPVRVPLDTLSLAGFDSPQLERSRLWAAGEVDEPPLLTPAAAALGDHLFVLNARPGWVRIDVFRRDDGPDGPRLLLERALVQPDPAVDKTFLPVDLAVRRVEESVEFIVLTTKPRPGLTFLRWTEDSQQSAASRIR